MGNIKIKKSNKKYNYKVFSEWYKSQKLRKRLVVVLLLLFVIIFSFFPIWLFQKAGNVIEGTFDWEDDPYGIWIDEALVGYTIELWRDGVLYSSSITDSLGNVKFYAPDMDSAYQLIVASCGLSYNVVDLDTDGYFDLVDGQLPMDTVVVTFRFAETNDLVLNTDIDILYFDGMDWLVLCTLATNGEGTIQMYLIDGEYSVWISNITFVVDLSDGMSSDIPSVLYIEPIVMLISSIIIMYLIIWKRKSRIIIITNKSVRNLENRYDNSEIRNYGNTITKNEILSSKFLFFYF